MDKAVLIGVASQGVTEEDAREYLEELAFLAETAGLIAGTRYLQKLEYPNPKTYIGSGKLEEIHEYIKANDISVAIVDDELSPSQLRNIEQALGIQVLDRTNLILDIFASRAKTSYAMVQVELAQYQYLLPRLAGMWTHLERQRGGIGMRGPGEREIETDRRIVRDRISLLKEHLEKIDRQKATQRGNRGTMVRVALVGYTNVGKSTLMNKLAKADVFAENKLFATLDTTVRKVVIGNLPFLISDTVGFIRKLPHHLVESFKSTLDEVREADILLHVVDISHPRFEEQIQIVNDTLFELGAAQKKTIMVFNKIDAYKHVPQNENSLYPVEKKNITLEEWKSTWLHKNHLPSIFISALRKENFDVFRELLFEEVKNIHLTRYPNDQMVYFNT